MTDPDPDEPPTFRVSKEALEATGPTADAPIMAAIRQSYQNTLDDIATWRWITIRDPAPLRFVLPEWLTATTGEPTCGNRYCTRPDHRDTQNDVLRDLDD